MLQKLRSLFHLQLKLTLKKLPVIFIGTVLFSGATAFLLFGFLSAEKQRGATSLSRSTIGVVYDTSDSTLGFALSYLGSMRTVNRLCRLQTADETEALQKLREEEFDAVVFLPDGLVESILDGTNLPAKIILKNSGVNSSSGLVHTFLDTAASDLATAQAGIYTLGLAAHAIGLSAQEQAELNQQINKDYFQLFLNREKIFSKKSVSATGSFTLIQYYVCSGFVLILLFSGISCAGLLAAPDIGIRRVLSRQPLVLGSVALFQSLAVSLPYLLASVLAFYFLKYTFFVPSLFVIIFTALSMSTLLYRACRDSTIAMLVICGSSVGMLFLAGGFIPSVFLPDTLTAAGQFLPAGCMLNATKAMIQKAGSFPISCLFYGMGFNLLSGFLDCKFTR